MEIDRYSVLRRAQSLYSAAAFVILALGLGTLLVVAKDLLVPIALAVLLSFALSPFVRALQRIGAHRSVAIAFALAFALAVLAVCLWLLTGQVAEVGAQLPSYQTTIDQKIHAVADRFSGNGQLSRLFAMIEDLVKEVAPTKGAGTAKDSAQRVVVVEDSPFAQIGALGGYASPLLSPIIVTALVLLLTGFMLAQHEDLRNRLISLIGAKDIKRTTEAIDDAGRRVGRIMFAQLALNSAYGACIGVGLWLIGVPNPWLWAAIAGVARFVPYFGVAVGLVPALLVAFAFDPSWKPFLETLALFSIAEPITGQVIEPVLYGHSSGLSPVAVVISTAVWAYMWGPIGLVLATPLTVCIVVIGRHAPALGFIETLLGDEPPLEPHEMFYQRMLAGDPHEALLQAKHFLKDRGIVNYYDEIALDAVRRAHVDVARGEFESNRLTTLIQSMLQLIDWLGALPQAGTQPCSLWAARPGAWARGRPRPEVRAQLPDPGRSETQVAIVHDDHPLDAIPAAMLEQALTRQGLSVQVASLTEAQEIPSDQAAEVAIVFLSFVESLPLPVLRVVATSVRSRCPHASLVLCTWLSPDRGSLNGQAKPLRVDFVATSISSALSAALRLTVSKRFLNARQRHDASPAIAGSFRRANRNQLPEVS